MKQPSGLKRKRRYSCCQCLGEVREYPFLVVDKNYLWCEECRKQSEGGETKR